MRKICAGKYRIFIFIIILAASFMQAHAQVSSNIKLYPVLVDGKWGYINRNGILVVKPQYDGAGDFYDGRAAVRIGIKRGYIDDTGKIAIPLSTSNLGYKFHEGLAPVRIKHLYGSIDVNGNIVIEPKFRKLTVFSEGLAATTIDGKAAFIDKDGNVQIKTDGEDAYNFSEELAGVRMAYRCGFIDKTGAMVIQPKYDIYNFDYFISSDEQYLDCNFKEGLACIGSNRLNILGYGFMDKSGKFAIEPGYLRCRNFSEGLAGVIFNRKEKMGQKWGFINKKGDLIIHARFDRVYEFRGGIARVEVNHSLFNLLFRALYYWMFGIENPHPSDYEVGYIDKTGNYVWQPTD